MEIVDERSLSAWLSGKPGEWAQALALRAAFRALPYIGISRDSWLKNFALLPFRAILTSWVQLTESSIDIFKGSRANAWFGGEAFDFSAYNDDKVAACAANASYHSADAQTKSVHVFNDCIEAIRDSENIFEYSLEKIERLNYKYDSNKNEFWSSVEEDCYILSRKTSFSSVLNLAVESIWSGNQIERFMAMYKCEFWWQADWKKLPRRLLAIDPNYSVWIEWYERRIRGERSAFDIPGDKRRIEDKAILRRLAEATDEDFWGKGHEYVNATLKGWLDEARARLVPPPIPIYASGWSALTEHSEAELGPPQEPGALAYGVNAQGKLDRLPVSDQVHLRDVPDQRRAYQDLREAAAALLEEGQRLGHRLKRALERFLQSLPERFEDAEAYLVWRDANALRRLHRAHREAAKSPEPDEAKLEPVVAEGLGGVLDLYNHFAFADDGLRAKDEARISPQERASAKAEAKVATPVVNAILATPDIATPEALDDIMADAESAELPADDPYADQVLAQANRTRRNWIAGLLEGGKQALANPKLLGKRTAIGVAIGVGTKVGEAVATAVFDMNSAHVLNFIATNATLLQGYVAVAFSSYPHLPELIGRIDLFWQRYGRK